METRQVLKLGLTLGLFFVSLVMLNNAFGKHRRITSSRGLADAVEMRDLVAASFYVEDKNTDKAEKEKIRILQRDFRTLSKTDRYEYVSILFISACVNKEDMIDMVVRHGVIRPEKNSPSFALFRGGKLVVCLSGFLDREEMRSAIDQHFGSDIARIEKEKAAQRQRRIEAARVREAENAAAYPYWYSGWPYYGGWYGYGSAWPYYGGGSWWGPSWRGWGGGYHGSYHGGSHGGGHGGGHHR